MIELSVVQDSQAGAQFEEENPTVIKVVGCGGGGSNAVRRMISAGVKDVEFVVMNTDLQALNHSTAQTRIAIGQKLTGGLGAGGNPAVGESAANEDREEIARALTGADMVIITAGMGGGTGTGSAPVVAGIAREAGILTIAVVTTPFEFEGPARMSNALEGIKKLRKNVDSLIVIPNKQVMKVAEKYTDKPLPWPQAFRLADDVLCQGVQGISEIITRHGEINLDFADVKSVMKNQGDSILGVGFGSGENRAITAAQEAINNPMLENRQIDGASKILINITGSENLSMLEVEEIVNNIKASAAKYVEVFVGLVLDQEMGEKVAVTVIATGFDQADSGDLLTPDSDNASAEKNDNVFSASDFAKVLRGGMGSSAGDDTKDTETSEEEESPSASSLPLKKETLFALASEGAESSSGLNLENSDSVKTENVSVKPQPRPGVHSIPSGITVRSDDLSQPAVWRNVDNLPRGINLSE